MSTQWNEWCNFAERDKWMLQSCRIVEMDAIRAASLQTGCWWNARMKAPPRVNVKYALINKDVQFQSVFSPWISPKWRIKSVSKCRLDVRGQRVAIPVVYFLNIVTLTSVSQSFKRLPWALFSVQEFLIEGSARGCRRGREGAGNDPWSRRCDRWYKR